MKKIGAVARQEGLSARTIIRLERAGAIAVRRDRNGTRVFDEQDIARLRAVLYPDERPDPAGQPEDGGGQ
jgi:DNA-binding transcriptional MerR regulator